MKRAKADYTIQAVAHAFDLLEEFRESGEEELGVTELASKLRLHKNNVFRLLATLESRGYVEQNPVSQNYRLGIKVLELGQAFVRQTGLLRHSDAVLRSIVEKVNETAYVTVIREGAVVYLNAVEADRTVRVVSRVGHRLPIFASACGKAQAAFWKPDQLDHELREVAKKTSKAYTPNTIVDPEKLREELRVTAARGYGLDNEEYELGVRCVAAPVFDYTGGIRGAITVSGPSSRMTEPRIQNEIVPVITAAAKELSRQLGHGK